MTDNAFSKDLEYLGALERTNVRGRGNLRSLTEGNIDLIDLTDFDVQLALTKDDGVQLYEVLKIMTEFLNEEFQACLASQGTYATFDTVILLERARRLQMEALERDLEENPSNNGEVIVGDLFTASFKGAALFTRLENQLPLPPSIVEGCQRQAFLEEDILLTKLQQAGGNGLGTKVVDVRAYINPNTSVASNDDDSSDSLEVVIIIAIVIACVAFLFLVFAIYWAWRYDKKNRDAYLTDGSAGKSPETTRTFKATDSPDSKEARPPKHVVSNQRSSQQQQSREVQSAAPSYPSVIGGESVADGVYPESVISDDINSSLTQYYQSGLQNYTATNGRLQDAGSVSSMESYGYSLDGYAPSLATPMPADTTAILSTAGTGTLDGGASAAARPSSVLDKAGDASQKREP
eukprot:CAMPEP_0172442866 /NCGR_PEP_ID=MMETSP1065-20121228/3239_1 /TAXON_ID=265537 /ORGANISM="Amphiprora paludosa, Strain CCMP125" /LENGTH=405 /DNA_ID=CAMNT_0013192911 /DNA_START=134 /DNA_END=1351 /DNA_ORIENTATION=+